MACPYETSAAARQRVGAGAAWQDVPTVLSRNVACSNRTYAFCTRAITTEFPLAPADPECALAQPARAPTAISTAEALRNLLSDGSRISGRDKPTLLNRAKTRPPAVIVDRHL